MNLLELLDDLDIPHIEQGHEHCRPGWSQMDCPSCSRNSQHWRLGLNLQFGYFSCWSCAYLSFYDTLMELSGVSFRELKAKLSGIEFLGSKRRKPVVRGKLIYPKGVGRLARQHKNYLKGRGFDPEQVAELWGIGATKADSTLPWRVFIPIRLRTETVSWTTRSISDKVRMRYISASPSQEALPHKDLLYGEEHCRNAIVIVEGPLDAWRIGPGAVATFGTAYSQAQVWKMAQYPVRAIVLDNERSAQKRARELASLLEVFPGSTYVVQIDAKDPGSASPKEIRTLRRIFLD